MNIQELEKKAAQIRYNCIKMIGAGKKGHYGGALSCADIVAALYFGKMRIDPKNPKWEKRDRFVLSKGHAAFVQYAALALAGYFPMEELLSAKKVGSMLQGHPDMRKTPGIECNTGSLAQGISQAAGMAAGLKIDGSDSKVYFVLGDGEMGEGQVWEAAMAAYNFRLDNLVGILDRNGMEATGHLQDRYDIGDVRAKWDAFGWHTMEADGHDISQLLAALNEADNVKDRPVMIIAHTVKGKGVSIAENTAAFHNGEMTQEQFDLALGELEAAMK